MKGRVKVALLWIKLVSWQWSLLYMGVSKNRGTPKSSILIRCSIIKHPFWDTPYFWKHPYLWTNDVAVVWEVPQLILLLPLHVARAAWQAEDTSRRYLGPRCPVAALYRRGTACLSCTERSMSTCPLACADMIIIWLLLLLLMMMLLLLLLMLLMLWLWLFFPCCRSCLNLCSCCCCGCFSCGCSFYGFCCSCFPAKLLTPFTHHLKDAGPLTTLRWWIQASKGPLRFKKFECVQHPLRTVYIYILGCPPSQ